MPQPKALGEQKVHVFWAAQWLVPRKVGGQCWPSLGVRRAPARSARSLDDQHATPLLSEHAPFDEVEEFVTLQRICDVPSWRASPPRRDAREVLPSIESMPTPPTYKVQLSIECCASTDIQLHFDLNPEAIHHHYHQSSHVHLDSATAQ